MKMIFLINATSAKTSGALTVLKDCIAYIEQNPIPGKEYHLITVMDIFNAYKNIRVHKVNVQNWSSRIQWDNGGLQKWCKKNKLDPDAIISLQNTSTKYGKNGLMVTQVVYYHQPIPLYPLNGIGVDFKQKLYHYFYPFFVNRYNTQSHYVVQLPCMGVVSSFTASGPELEHWLKGKNKLCDYLVDVTIKAANHDSGISTWTRVIWDVTAIGWLLDGDFMLDRLEHSPIPEYSHHYSFDPRRHLIRYVYHINRDNLFKELFEKLSK